MKLLNYLDFWHLLAKGHDGRCALSKSQSKRTALERPSSQPSNTVLPFPVLDFVVESIPHSTTTPSPSSSSTSPMEDPPPPNPLRHSSRATRPPTHLGDYCCSHVQASSSSPSTSLVRSSTFSSISHSISYGHFSPSYKAFLVSISRET
ncbi:hypothetical protein NE237_024992 [Protea cynaroides]|uniref:Uncharacterized protein n=1 Tax=Protea cynaroides TaxID=273540 RepID=A0A9Q0H3B2_9MAGN|nr:hypothetical protein NE237_024992 [Protea cynaroides]